MEKMILVGMQEDQRFEYKMDELEALCKACGGEVLGRVTQKTFHIDPRTYIGQGKAEEVKELSQNMEADTIVFLHELSGAQIRNLEKMLEKKIVDRTMLILDIFAQRARSKEGRLEIYLAQLKYRLPRLKGYADYLSREGGGIGTRGPGEQKTETDRRHIMREIDRTKEKLNVVRKNRELLRERRKKSGLPMVSLFGYTNAGKSTLMNGLLKKSGNDKQVFVKDMLFATLETRLRRCTFPRGGDFLLTDTVGLIRDLPTEFIEGFSSTLEEVKESDLILHVVDVTDQEISMQVETTKMVLKKLGLEEIPILTVYNKGDKLTPLEGLYHARGEDEILISAHKEEDLDRLLEKIQSSLDQYKVYVFLFPYQDMKILSSLMEEYEPMDLVHLEEGVRASFYMLKSAANKYKEFLEVDHV